MLLALNSPAIVILSKGIHVDALCFLKERKETLSPCAARGGSQPPEQTGLFAEPSRDLCRCQHSVFALGEVSQRAQGSHKPVVGLRLLPATPLSTPSIAPWRSLHCLLLWWVLLIWVGGEAV